MEYEVDIKSIVKEAKTDKCENTDSIEEIKKRIHDKISMITINYNKWVVYYILMCYIFSYW